MARKVSKDNILATKEPSLKASTKRSKRVTKARKETSANIPSYEAVRFNGAEYDKELNNHWIFVDSKSIDQSLNPETRRRLRERARYEAVNNPIATRAASILVGDCIGNGCRLQLTTGALSGNDKRQRKDFNSKIESDFHDWADSIRLFEKLSSMRYAKFVDGESFGILYNNPSLFCNSGVTLDLAPIDAERVCGDYTSSLADDRNVDGITIDEFGNPLSYRVLTRHPGSISGAFNTDSRVYKASQIVHWYNRVSPEQRRGASELAPCLGILARLDRYQKAVLSAAETAANLACILYTDLSAAEIEEIMPEENPLFPSKPGQAFPIGAGTSWALPAGFKASQLRAEQPSSGYLEFADSLLATIGGALGIPLMFLKNSCIGTTYSGGRLELQTYLRTIRREQKNLELSVLNKIFSSWYEEWAILNNESCLTPPHIWYFDGWEHQDPSKEASAIDKNLSNNSTNLASIYGKLGRDWEDELEQRARELKKMKDLETSLGISFSTSTNNVSNEEKDVENEEELEENEQF